MDSMYCDSGEEKDPGCLFMEVLLSGNIPVLKELLDSGKVDVNEPINGGPTPLVIALIKQDIALVRFLLEHKASPTKTCLRVMSHVNNAVTCPLQFAIDSSNLTIVTMLIDHGADPQNVYGGFSNFLLFAVKMNSIELADYTFRMSDIDFLQEHYLMAEALHIAIKQENPAMIRLLIKNGASANRELKRLLPLTYAAYLGKVEICKLLMSLGAHLDGHGISTPLSCAITTGFEGAVPVLLQLGCKVNKLLKWSQYSSNGDRLAAGSSYLHLAVACHKYEAAKCLIEKGISMNIQDPEGNTALHIAARDVLHPESVRFLLNYVMPQICVFRGRTHGIPKSRRHPFGGIQGHVYPRKQTDQPLHIVLFSSRNFQGRTALMEAVICQNVEAVRLMVEGFRVSGTINIADNSGFTALHHAVVSHHEELTLILLEGGADVNVHVKPALPALHTAVKKGLTSMAHLLINYQADTTVRTPYSDYTLLHLAVEANSIELVVFMLQQGFDVNAKGTNGSTPLILAACGSHPEIVQSLVDSGALLDVQEFKQQDSALSNAVYFGLADNALILFKEGANAMLKDSRGSTVLDWCMFNCRPHLLKLLVSDDLSITLAKYRKFPRNLTILMDTELDEWIVTKISNPRKLEDLCRITIRNIMRRRSEGVGIVRFLNQLPLPRRIIEYLCYDVVEEGLLENKFWHSVHPDNLNLNALSIDD